MNGVEKDTFLEIVQDKKAGGMIYDALSTIHGAVTNQPSLCEKKFIKRWHVYIGFAVIIGILIGLEVVPIRALIPFIPK